MGVEMKKVKYTRRLAGGRLLRKIAIVAVLSSMFMIEKALDLAIAVAIVSPMLFLLGNWIVVKAGGRSAFNPPDIEPIVQISGLDFEQKPKR